MVCARKNPDHLDLGFSLFISKSLRVQKHNKEPAYITLSFIVSKSLRVQKPQIKKLNYY